MSDYDLSIQGGTIVDGTGVPRYRGDIWIKDGRIAKIGGRGHGIAERVIDAEGHIVCPGFIDLHTHYDAQIRWDPWCTISGWHGVTTVVLGNCGLGFAPVRPAFRDRAMQSITRVEAIPYEVVKGALPWDWETVPEYMASLAQTPLGVNCAQFMPTGLLMAYVMGWEDAKKRPATEAERGEMARLLNEGMDAGLCGFSIQRLGPDSAQSDSDGSPMITDLMCDEDIFNLATVLRKRDQGFIQLTQFTGDHKADYAFRNELARIAARPVLHNVIAVSPRDASFHQRQLEWLEKCNANGMPMYGQGVTLRSGYGFTLENWNMYDASPAWREASMGTHEEKLLKFGDLQLRQAMKEEVSDRRLQLIWNTVGGPIRFLILAGVGGREELERYVGRTIGDIAEETNKDPIDAMLDIAVASDLKAEFLGIHQSHNPENMASMIHDSPFTIPGVSDGGAHTKFFNGGAFTTDFLTWLVRDEKKLTLEEAHYRLSALPAHIAGFRDRGVLREGTPADIVVYDLDALAIDPPVVGSIQHDYPANEWRRVQKAIGYRAIIVNGVVTFENGRCTGATPGRILP